MRETWSVRTYEEVRVDTDSKGQTVSWHLESNVMATFSLKEKQRVEELTGLSATTQLSMRYRKPGLKAGV